MNIYDIITASDHMVPKQHIINNFFFLDRCQLEITQTSWAWTEIHKGIFEKIF